MTQNNATNANPYSAPHSAAEIPISDVDSAKRVARNRKASRIRWLGICLPAGMIAAMVVIEGFFSDMPAGPVLFALVACWGIGWIVACVTSFYVEDEMADKIAYSLVIAPILMLFLLFALFFVLIPFYGIDRS